jgi:hypothetical protein
LIGETKNKRIKPFENEIIDIYNGLNGTKRVGRVTVSVSFEVL